MQHPKRALAALFAAVILFACTFGIAISAEEAFTMGDHDILVDPKGAIKTVAEAQAILRAVDVAGHITVWIKGGAYSEPLEFTAADRPDVTWRAVPGEEAVFTGAKEITGWAADTANGVACWSVRLEAGDYFTSLYHPTQQLSRPRYPAEGYLFVESVEGAKMLAHESQPQYHSSFLSFFAKPGDLRPFHGFQDVTLRVLHFWKDEITNLVSCNAATGELVWERPSAMTVRAGDRYFLENVFEELKQPGQWYLDRASAKLYYIPFAGEVMAETTLYAGVHERMLTVDGGRNLTFKGIAIQNTAWNMPNGVSYGWGMPSGGSEWNFENRDFSQAAYNVRPCAYVTNSTAVRFEDCKFDRIGATALKFGPNTHDSGVTGSEFTQIGANAVFIEGTGAGNSNITVTNNLIAHYGRRFFNAIGVLNIHAHHVEISHNEIYDGYYTGISSGWVWGYSANPTDYVAIADNLIYNIGQGWLSDMGGIYCLGPQIHSVITGNLIHDVAADPAQGGYGGWGIYLDEGSTGQLVEKNLVYKCGSQGFHQHYGKENMVRNNIFALSGEGQIRVSRKEEHTSIFLEQNIIVTDGQPLYTSVEKDKFKDDTNLYYDYGCAWFPYSVTNDGRPASNFWDCLGRFFDRRSVLIMRMMGYYKCGVFCDPLFTDIANLDFTLRADSPAIEKIGFETWDYGAAGRITA